MIRNIRGDCNTKKTFRAVFRSLGVRHALHRSVQWRFRFAHVTKTFVTNLRRWIPHRQRQDQTLVR
jgi:hypothetical protein